MPRITGPGTLSLHLVSSAEDLEAGPFGLFQPTENAPAVESGEIDLAIVPGVAFDHECDRVGYGGGYYDRLLTRMPNATLIGLAFDGQVVERIACDDHDVRDGCGGHTYAGSGESRGVAREGATSSSRRGSRTCSHAT